MGKKFEIYQGFLFSSNQNTLRFLFKISKRLKNNDKFNLKIKRKGIFFKIWVKKLIIFSVNRLYKNEIL
jgi:hypothetical protein